MLRVYQVSLPEVREIDEAEVVETLLKIFCLVLVLLLLLLWLGLGFRLL